MPTAATYAQTATQRVHMGRPAAEAVAEEAGQTGAQRVFLMASRSLRENTDEIERIQQALGERFAGLYDGMPPHGPRGAVLEAAALAREAGADLLVSVGGGSITDATKVLAVCLTHGIREHADFDAYRMQVDASGQISMPEFSPPEVPVVCVPTTLSGGEFNPLSGVTDEREKLKQGYTQRDMVPVAVVLDPAITVHTPQWLWLSTGVRAVDHAMETLGSFLSNPFCDDMASCALRNLQEGLQRVHARPDDLDARLSCQIGAWQSMLPIVAGIPMGISHATGHALGGTFDVPHGHTSCVMAPFALAFNQSVNGERQQRISAALGKPDEPASKLADELIRNLGMPRSLTEVGVTEADLPKLADAVMHDIWARTNPRDIENADQAREFLRTAL